jgi:predicted glycosyltransferase
MSFVRRDSLAAGKMHKRQQSLKIWIDIENSPHVLFLEPVIRELEGLGHTVVTTARDFCNTLPLVRSKGLLAKPIGAGYDRGRTQMLKQSFWFFRVLQLRQFALAQRFDVAASHSSRTQAVAARHLGIPTFTTQDYEHQDLRAFRHARCFMIPDVVPVAPFVSAGISPKAIRTYEGLKEDVYLADFRPSINIRAQLGISEDQILVTFRPASDNAHYLSHSGSSLQYMLLDRLLGMTGVHVLLLPRTERQRKIFETKYKGRNALQVARDVMDGPSLIYESDLAVSGGGTMVREAAVLGVPAVSCFEGRLGAVDQHLVQAGKLMVVSSQRDVRSVKLVKRVLRSKKGSKTKPLVSLIQGICEVVGRS